MTLYLGTWQIMDTARVPCMTYFGSMTNEDDKAESNGVEMLGRWGDLGAARGAVVCRATNYEDVANWIYNWVPMATCKIKPICDDNTAREIILGRKPDYLVDYSHVGDEPSVDENLYMITYKFHESKKMDGYKAFANLSEEEDKQDAGNCRPLGRWHDLGTGSGMAVAVAKSEADIYAWAFHWTEICQCEIVPVLTDSQSRKLISSKPDFESKLKSVKESMG
jgi:hypothetical protein